MSSRCYDKVIRRHVTALMPARIKKLAGAAHWDLMYGPHSRADFRAEGIRWPGYMQACERIQDWIDSKMPRDLWLDTQSDDVQASEPEGWTDEETGEYVEPFLEDFVHFDAHAITRVVFGELVGNGID